MKLERYTVFTSDFKDYEFYSEGPRGRVKKVVRYTRVADDPITYNLSFGDKNERGEVSDTVITDNLDRDIVLSTVANTISAFCDHYGNHYVYAEGSTLARTRLYQIGISRLWKEIIVDFDIWGYKDGAWHDFTINVNYEALLMKRK